MKSSIKERVGKLLHSIRCVWAGSPKPAFDLPYRDGPWVWLPATPDQKRLEKVLAKEPLEGKTLLHVGIGSSRLAKKFYGRCHTIDGITIMPPEISYARRLHIPNYHVYLLNKYSAELRAFGERYDYIIDNNLSSYAPTTAAFAFMIESYTYILKKKEKF